MIECIFISDSSNRLLFGSHPILSDLGFSLSGEIWDEDLVPIEIKKAQISSVKYPITYLKSSRIAHLKVNDVILNILYQGIDNFQAAKFLLDLRGHIEDKIINLTSKTVKRHYFLLLDMLQGTEIGYKAHPDSITIKESVFIDIVQNINCITSGDTTLVNSSQGEIFLDHTGIESLEVTLEKRDIVATKSTHKIQQEGNLIKIHCVNLENANLLSFYQKNIDMIYFKMKRTGNTVTVESEYKGVFKFIEIAIPVGMHTFKVDPNTSKGKCEFDIKSGILYWRFKESNFQKETVKFNISTLDEDVEERPVTVNFRIENSNNCALKLVNTINPSCPGQQFWVRNTTQSGYYELNSN